MDRPVRVTFGKEHQYGPTLTEFRRCSRHPDGTLRHVPLPQSGSEGAIPIESQGNPSAERTDVTSPRIQLLGQCGRRRIQNICLQDTSMRSSFGALRHDINLETPKWLSLMVSSSTC